MAADEKKKRLSKLKMPAGRKGALSIEDLDEMPMDELKDHEAHESQDEEDNESPEMQKKEREMGLDDGSTADTSEDDSMGDMDSQDSGQSMSDSELAGHGEEGSEDQENADSDQEEQDHMDRGHEELAKISDDELLAEIKKRGLMSKMLDHGEHDEDEGPQESLGDESSNY